MKLMVELEGETVPLAGCHYVRWAACGCPTGVTDAGAHRVDPVIVEDDAWKQFYTRKADRAAAKKRGERMELMTHARYSAEVYPLMLARTCPHKPVADKAVAAGEEQRPMPEIRNVDAGHDRRLLLDAARDVIKHQSISQRLIQRRVCVGFVKAERLLILLEEAGVIGPRKTGGRHEVLVPRGRADEVIAVLEKELADAATR